MRSSLYATANCEDDEDGNARVRVGGQPPRLSGRSTSLGSGLIPCCWILRAQIALLTSLR